MIENVSFLLQNVSDRKTTSNFKREIVLLLNLMFSGYLSEFHPFMFQAPILSLLLGGSRFIFSVKSEKVSTGGKLLGFKEQPVPIVVVVPRVEGVSVEGDPHVEPLPAS